MTPDTMPDTQTNAARLRFTEPFSHLNVPGPAERAAWEARLEIVGIRRFPPPFGHTIAVLSDIDDSDRERSGLYHTQLIRELGLDFGDSCWLFGRQFAQGTQGGGFALNAWSGLGIIHPSLDPAAWDASELACVRSFREMVGGALRGDFDHFHAFVPSGHRVVWIERTDTKGNDAIFRVPVLIGDGQFQSAEMRVAGLGVVGTKKAIAGVEDAVAMRDDDPDHPFSLVPNPEGLERALRLGYHGEASLLLGPERRPGPDNPLPHLWRVDEIRVRCDCHEAAAGLRAVAVLNATAPLILDTLADLDEQWNVRSSLITEHSGYCFLNQRSWEFHSNRIRTEAAKPSEARRGWVIELSDEARQFSALADDPDSFCRLFPDLVRRRGFRFINPGGLTGSPDYSFDAQDVVAPSVVRDGSGVYICRRMLPTLPEGVDADDPVLKATRAPSFGHRLRRLFELMLDRPDRVWPFYTHLGTIKPLEQAPDPYLEREPLLELQDRVYGITGRVQPADRAWFVRGTGMCEHALLMQGLATNVQRTAANTVRITPWRDETLACELPVSISQTYGLTFRVRDLADAGVLIGEREVHELARFDHSDGRWVTLMPSVIREVVVGQVDPFGRPDAAPHRIRASVNAEQLHDAGITLQLEGPGRGLGHASFDAQWLDPTGAQGFVYQAVAQSRNAGLAWLVETVDGGRFAWGDSSIVGSLEGLTAWRAEPVPIDATVTVPFWDLTWANGAEPGGPLPTRDIARIELIVRGSITVSNAAFIRPSAAQRDAPQEGTVVVGRVPMERTADWTVHLVPIEGGATRECRPDPRGWFAFSSVRRSVCRVWATDGAGHRFTPRGGDLVETRWNQTSLVFDEPS